jgi:transcriptional regulator with XRE-family HTH domain
MHKLSAPPAFNVALLQDDMAAKGWLPIDLARKAAVSHMTVSRFLSGERRTARTAKKLATALGQSVRRYLILSNEAVAS